MQDGSPRVLHTHFELSPKHCPLPQGRAVPAPVPELELALPDAHLHALPHHDDGVGPALADRPLTGGQTGDFVADDAGSQRDHRPKPPVGGERRVKLPSALLRRAASDSLRSGGGGVGGHRSDTIAPNFMFIEIKAYPIFR